MNTPAPLPPASAGNPVTASGPTLGSIIGGALGIVAATKLGLNPTDITGGAVVSGIAGLFTALFHWGSQKLGVPLG